MAAASDTFFPCAVHGVAEPRFEERVAGLSEVPFGTEDGVPGFEVGVNKGTEI